MKSQSMMNKIYPRKVISFVDRKIKLLGINCRYQVFTILNILFICSLLIFEGIFLFVPKGYILAPVSVLIFLCLFEVFVFDLPIYKRKKRLEQEAIFFFQIFSLTLESNRNLKSALALTCQNIDNELSKEFQKALLEMDMGKSFSESLTAMKERIPSETIHNLILHIIEANSFGSNMTDSLQEQITNLQEQQLLDIKASIMKIPTKISIISALIFGPLLFLLIISPILIRLFLS